MYQKSEKNTGPRNKFKKRGGVGAGLHLATAIDWGRRAAGSYLGKRRIGDAIDYLPTAYRKIKNKINKKVKAVINTGVDDYLVNKEIDLIAEKFN